jgi:hypothetical protein
VGGALVTAKPYPELTGHLVRGAVAPPPQYPGACPTCGAVAINDGAYACGGEYTEKPQIQTHTVVYWGACGERGESWCTRLPEGLSFDEFAGSDPLRPSRYGAWDTDGVLVLAWNTEEEFVDVLAAFERAQAKEIARTEVAS